MCVCCVRREWSTTVAPLASLLSPGCRCPHPLPSTPTPTTPTTSIFSISLPYCLPEFPPQFKRDQRRSYGQQRSASGRHDNTPVSQSPVTGLQAGGGGGRLASASELLALGHTERRHTASTSTAIRGTGCCSRCWFRSGCPIGVRVLARDTIARGAELAGDHALVHPLRGGRRRPCCCCCR